MRNVSQRLWFFVITLLVLATMTCHGETSVGQQLRVPIRYMFGNAPLEFHKLAALTSDTRIAISRLEYIVSNVRLQDEHAAWSAQSTAYYHFNPLEQDHTDLLMDVPTTITVGAIGFDIGVPSGINHGDPAHWPAGHPLNVLECNLYWSWQVGYVFLAVEGYALQPAQPRKTFLYHLGNEPQLMHVDLPLPKGVVLAGSEIVFHVDRAWKGTEAITADDGRGLTHSADGDKLAPRLARNIEKAFEVRRRVSP